jgi:hypothetical protein
MKYKNRNFESVSEKNEFFFLTHANSTRAYPLGSPFFPRYRTTSQQKRNPLLLSLSSTASSLGASVRRRRTVKWLSHRSRASSSVEVESSSRCRIEPSSRRIEPCWPQWSTLVVATRLWCHAARTSGMKRERGSSDSKPEELGSPTEWRKGRDGTWGSRCSSPTLRVAGSRCSLLRPLVLLSAPAEGSSSPISTATVWSSRTYMPSQLPGGAGCRGSMVVAGEHGERPAPLVLLCC